MVTEPLSAGSEIVKQVVVETREVKNPSAASEKNEISPNQRPDNPVIIEKKVVRAGHEKEHAGGVLIISGTALLLIIIILLIVLL